ncbi:T9SS C-terminal target domain-containing protein [Thermophagus sp. OGC60D27]|uniref:T9SS C-terminal target domain-containing protein n=1 Tax=Thermophagus sp. OGC60D27 TaxID=3458415 RepID=UPI004037E06A
MKAKKFLTVTALAVMMVGLAIPASAKGKIKVYPYLNTDFALIAALNEDMNDFAVEIKTMNGELVYNSGKVANSASFNKLFDFSELSDGKYVAVLKSNDKTFLKDEFMISGGKLVHEKAESNEEAPIAKVWTKSNFLFVSYLNKSFDSYTMRLKDSNGGVLFESALPKDLTYSGKFDVSALPAGTYYVSLISGEKESSYAISK